MTTMRTIKLKKITSAETLPDPATAPLAATASAPPPGLEPSSATPKASGRSYLIYALLAIAATLFCIAIIGMQYTEWSFYKADPSLWPVK
jgi:hypothetical protein